MFATKIADEFLLKKESWIVDLFQHLKKTSNFFSKRFSTRMSQLLTTYPDENFDKIFPKIITFGTWPEVFRTMREKILAWAKLFSLLAKVFRQAYLNWKLFVHLSSLKLLKNSENHRGATWETFRNFWTFWSIVEQWARTFLPFDKILSVGDSKLTFTYAERIFGGKNAFLKDFGTLTKSWFGF